MKVLKEKVFTKEVLLYGIFGVMTTLVNWGLFYILTNFVGMGGSEVLKNVANFIAIIAAVIFAYFTNRSMVFHSDAKGVKEKLIEFCKFMLGRAFTMGLEWLICFLLFMTSIPEMVTKVIVTIIVIILNFFISKYFSFRRKDAK